MARHLLFFVSGVIFWTFLEYLIHRFLGHQKKGRNAVRAEHQRHHAEAHYFAPLYKKLLLAIGVLSFSFVLFSLLAGMWNGLSFACGLAGMYLLYEITHRRFHVHEPLIRYGLRMRKHHFAHHFRDPRYNHGVTTAFWDRLFGTYRPVDQIRIPQKMAMMWLTDREHQVKKRYQRHFTIY